MRWIIYLLLKVAILPVAYAECNCAGFSSLAGAMRTAMLKRTDQFLNLLINQGKKNYPLASPQNVQTYKQDQNELIVFAQTYGYFSSKHPLVARVSNNLCDLECVLATLQAVDLDSPLTFFTVSELLAKALSYRDLSQNQKIKIAVKKGPSFHYETFTVDRIFDLWKGMPAFGLVPDQEGIASILLFRGTDPSITSKRGWASLFSDVDMLGPGFNVFLHARDEIHNWLKRVSQQKKKAVVVGYSLGGVLALYTFLYERAYLQQRGSIAFNPPGVTREICQEWENMPRADQLGFVSYIHRGDIISKSGYLVGSVFEVSTEKPMKPIDAHTALISGQKSFTLAPVDVRAENAQR